MFRFFVKSAKEVAVSTGVVVASTVLAHGADRAASSAFKFADKRFAVFNENLLKSVAEIERDFPSGFNSLLCSV